MAPAHFSDEIQVLCSDAAGNIYAAGEFKDDSGNCYVAKWNGSYWSEVGGIGSSGLRAAGNVLSINFDRHGNLYAAGAFENATGHTYVAKWDGTSWSEVGSGSGALNGNGAINTVFIDTNDNIYAAGNFTDSGVVDTGGNLYVAMWNGSAWSELGGGISHQIRGDIQIFSVLKDNAGNICATGNLRDGSNKCYVAKWDGTAWGEEGTGSAALNANDAITTMCSDNNGNLYAVGWFTDTTIAAGFNGHVYVAKWDGTSWSKLGSDFYDTYNSNYIGWICSDLAGNIYAAGGFVDTTVSYFFIDSAVSLSDTIIYHPRYVAKYGAATTTVAPLHITNGLNVYPNPTHSIINISFNHAINNFTGSDYCLYDCTGRIYRSGKLENENTGIDIAELPPSVYILKLTGQYNESYRIVKE